MQKSDNQININPEDTTSVSCKCGSEIFMQGFTVRKLSVIISPTGKEEVFTVPILLCASCGEPMIPEGGLQ